MSMTLPCYLAMTAAEFARTEKMPSKIGWMACRFSGSGRDLSNLPTSLPPGSMLILSDETPISGHDPQLILRELTDTVKNFDCCGVLLDFQRPDIAETAMLCRLLTQHLPCPVAVTEYYAVDLTCPVFLPPPLRMPLNEMLVPWKGREIWLEAVLEAEEATVTEEGTTICSCPLPALQEPVFREECLFCHYHWQKQARQVKITVERTPEDLIELLESATRWGVTKAVGLYQQLRNIPAFQ